MQIFDAAQIRAWDEYTIQYEPISSLDLMERAAATCYDWLMLHGYKNKSFTVYCGKGNNGGDGLAIARMLTETGHQVLVYILEFGYKGTDDFQANLARLHEVKTEVRFISNEEMIYAVGEGDVIIDALLGSGLNRPVEGLTARVVEHINTSANETIAIDLPSGLFADKSSKGNTIVNATHTLSFQCYKPAFLFAENEQYVGHIHILDIGLHRRFAENTKPLYKWMDELLANKIYKPRKKFSHKGTYGHALLVAGSYGKIGAAVLAAKACLRSGVGLLTVHAPKIGYSILQSTVPEAMIDVDADEKINTIFHNELSAYTSIGIGPGIGTDNKTADFLLLLFERYQKPMVLDADALNILADNKNLLLKLPPYSIVTPHPKEFERLFGKSANDFERVELAKQKAKDLNIIIVLKGHHTFIATPTGEGYFNATGNAGMATGGTGDVLTGIITSLIAQGYASNEAALLGVYIHGKAGDVAAELGSEEALIASDIIDHLGNVFMQFTVNHRRH